MRVMTVLGSPRKKGNTGTILEWIEEQLWADGHEVDHVHITDHHVAGCRGCWMCHSDGAAGCVQNDDANGLFQRMADADAVLLAAPVYCWGFPAPLKALLDRSVCIMGNFDDPDYTTRIAGKRFGLLLTAGGPEEDNADLVVKAFQAMAHHVKTLAPQHLLVPLCTTPEALGAEVRDRAAAFAREWLQ